MQRVLKNKKLANNGITLIALVITIIILLILAGIAISALTGENGLWTQSKEAKEQTKKSQVEEDAKLALMTLQIEESQKQMTQEEKRKFLEDEFKEKEPDASVDIRGTGFVANYSGYEVKIDKEYNVTVKEPFNAKKWDKTAAPEDVFIWESDDPNNEGYGVVIGYTANVENYTTLRFPSRCTKIEFTGDSNIATSRAFTNNILKAEIPGTVEKITSWAFGTPFSGGSFQNLEEVIIETGVKEIEYGAFEQCSNLATVVIPDSVTTIEPNAFDNTAWYNNQPDGLIYAGKVAYEYKGTMPSNTSLTLNDDTVGITEQAFYGCKNLTNITIPESVTSIGGGAFENCTGLTSIVIPDSVTSIGGGAFSYCTGLTRVNIPRNVSSIGSQAFYGCESLINITFTDKITSIGKDAFSDTAWYDSQPDGLIYAGKVAYRYKGTMPSNTNLNLNEGTVGIAGAAFSNCKNLTNITIPESITNIGEYAFSCCTGLTSIIIPENVTNIGGCAFEGCTGLTSIIIPENVTNIGEYAFKFWTETQTINCIIKDKPDGWNYVWDYYNSSYYGYNGYHAPTPRKANLVWGYTGE